MADAHQTSPLLNHSLSDSPELLIAIDEDSQSPHCDSNQNPKRLMDCPKPYQFLGIREPFVVGQTTLDPFRNETPTVDGFYEVLKIVVCLPIALLRLVLFGVSLGIGYVATRLALAGWIDKENPMPNWRRRVMWVTRLCARCILFSFGYQWIRKRGKPAPREIAPIVVSNHVSYIEPIFYFYELFPTIVASESHDSIPLVGTIIRAMQVIYVDRFSQASRKLAVNEIKRKASCDIFPRLLLFPEGTTTNGNVLISFQLGAFLPGYPIQPVVVRYPHVHFDQSWGNISSLKLMFRMFTQFHNFMELEYLPVVFPSDSQKENAVLLAEGTSHAIATALNVVQTSHSYGDLMLINKASELKLENPSRYMVEMARIKSLFDISTSEAVEFLYAFVSMNPDHSGCVKLHGFLKGMKIKNCRLSELIFEFIDAEKMGCITFKQFLYASAHVKKQPLFQQACELAFAECDAEGDGCISEQQFGGAIKIAIPDMNKDEVRGVFDLFDVDKDQRISRHDFLHCLRKYPLLIALFGPSMASNDF